MPLCICIKALRKQTNNPSQPAASAAVQQTAMPLCVKASAPQHVAPGTPEWKVDLLVGISAKILTQNHPVVGQNNTRLPRLELMVAVWFFGNSAPMLMSQQQQQQHSGCRFFLFIQVLLADFCPVDLAWVSIRFFFRVNSFSPWVGICNCSCTLSLSALFFSSVVYLNSFGGILSF